MSPRSSLRALAIYARAVSVLFVVPCVVIAQPAFELDFRAPEAVVGTAGSSVEFGASATLATTGLAAGSPGAQGWSYGVTLRGECEIVHVTTRGTAADDFRRGGYRRDGFEVTEIVDPGRNGGREGAVTAAILSNSMPITLPPEDVHETLRLVIRAQVPRQGVCEPCELAFAGDLRGSGEPVPIVISWDDRSFDPRTRTRRTQICPLPCFPTETVPGWPKWEVGESYGSCRVERELHKICAYGSGYGGRTDGVVALANTVVGGDFALAAEIVEIEGMGAAGLEARQFTGTFAESGAPALKLCVMADAAGAMMLHSELRSEEEPVMTALAKPVRVSLPLFLRVERRGDSIATMYGAPGQAMRDHAVVRRDLLPPALRVGMAATSDGLRLVEDGSLGVVVACFRDPVLTTGDPDRPPPRLVGLPVLEVEPVLGQDTRLVLRGRNLRDVVEVTVAGEKGEIMQEDDETLIVDVPAFDRPIRGDIVVRTPSGSATIPNGFFVYGKEWSRCDCDGNGRHEVTDTIRNLSFQFLGGKQCECPSAGDCDGDGRQNITDAIRLLSYLFLGGPPPPAPFPEPGTSPDTGETCGLEEHLPRILSISTESIREGDIFEIRGENFSTDIETMTVVAGNAQLRLLEATPTALTVQADIIPEGISRAPIGVIDDFLPNLFACFPKKCFPVFIGPIVFATFPAIELIPTEGLELVAQSRRTDDGAIEIQLDPGALTKPVDFSAELQVEALLDLPAVQGLSPGARRLSFSASFPPSFRNGVGAGGVGDQFFDVFVELVADQLQMELVEAGPLKDILVSGNPDTGVIRVEVSPELKARLNPELLFPGGIISIFWKVGRCGPEKLHPITQERAFGWCRIEEMTELCNGLPAFEWWYPKGDTLTTDDSPAYKFPGLRTPGDKSVMYNRAAYCHIRKHALWNNCALDELIADGFQDIPEFPIAAWVMKTDWRSSLPDGADADDFYSYVYQGPSTGFYTNGTRYYLTALHHTTKDIRNWFWTDLYPDFEGGGLGGCGGTNVDVPAGVADPFRKYLLCTNIDHDQPESTSGVDGVGPTATEHSAHCGNFEFSPECLPSQDGTPGDTCMRCHDGEVDSPVCCGGARYSNADGTINLDFLFSLQNSLRDPDPCGAIASVSFAADILPVFQTNCGCHSGGGGSLPSSMNLTGAAGTVWGQIVNVDAVESSLDRIEPGSPNSSYLWRKINDTHGAVGSGNRMPPPGNSLLSIGTRAVIEDWIQDGAPNN